MEYGALGLGAFFDLSGSRFQALDDKYLLPRKARQAFPDYAMAQRKAAVNVGPRAFGAQRDGVARMDEGVGGKGNYSGYVAIADQEELNSYGTRHGGAPGVP